MLTVQGGSVNPTAQASIKSRALHPLNPGDGGALPTGDYPPAGTRRSAAASPYGPAETSHRRGSPSRGVIRGSLAFAHHPRAAGCRPRPGSIMASRRSSPRLRPPDGTGAPWALTSSFAPRSYPRRTSRRRQAIAHWPGYYTSSISRTSTGASHLHSCTLTSHVIRGRLERDQLDPQARQVIAEFGDRAGGRRHLPHLGDPPARLGGVRHPRADHAAGLGHIDRGHPPHDLLVRFVLDLLRLPHHRTVSSPHRGQTHRAARGPRSGNRKSEPRAPSTVRDPSRSRPRRQTDSTASTTRNAPASAGNPPRFSRLRGVPARDIRTDRRKPRTSALKRSGASMPLWCPTPGMTTSLEPMTLRSPARPRPSP